MRALQAGMVRKPRALLEPLHRSAGLAVRWCAAPCNLLRCRYKSGAVGSLYHYNGDNHNNSDEDEDDAAVAS